MFRVEFFVVLLPYPQSCNCQASVSCHFHIRKQLTATPVYRAISVSARNHFYTCPRASIYVSHVAVVASRRKAATKEWRIPSFCVTCGNSRLAESIPHHGNVHVLLTELDEYRLPLELAQTFSVLPAA